MKIIARTIRWMRKQALALGFILLGIIGLILPIMPGWIFIALAVLLLAEDVPLFQRLIHKVERKWPRSRAVIARARHRLGQKPQPEPDCSPKRNES